MAFKLLKTDYVDAVFEGLRRYLVSENGDGSVSFHDVTNYTVKEGSFFGAKDVNTINTAVNAILVALENGTDLYGVFAQFFEMQKELFQNESDTKQEDFATYIAELKAYMSAKWNELKAEYTGDIQYFKDVQENAFNVWFQMVRDQLTNDVAGNLQTQIGNINELETEEKGSLTGAVNEVHGEIEDAKNEILTGLDEANERIDGIRVLKISGTISKINIGGKYDVWSVYFANLGNGDARNYVPQNGDILIFTAEEATESINEPLRCRIGINGKYYDVVNIAGSDNNPETVYLNLWKKQTVIFKVERFAGTLYFTPVNSNLYNSSSNFKSDTSIFRTLNMKGANDLWNAVMRPVESGCFTNDTVSLYLDIGKTYLLVTTEYTKSSGAVYGYRVRLAAAPADADVAKAAAGGNLIASTNAGVTISAETLTAVTPTGQFKCLTMKATSTYVVAYSLYEFGMFYGGTL